MTQQTEQRTDQPEPEPGGSIRGVRISLDGILEVVDLPDADAIADAVDGRNVHDRTARATWPLKGGDVVTVWTAASAPAHHPNTLAMLVVDALLPRLPGYVDRVWEALHDAPPAGPVLLTGYRPRTETTAGATVGVSDLAVDLVRSAVDGRRARAARTAAQDAPTAPIAAQTPPTATVPAPATPPDEQEPELVGTVADLAARLPTRPTPAALLGKKGRKTPP